MSQRCEELRLYNMVYNLTISNPSLIAVSSNVYLLAERIVFGRDY
jgi:hypothetical protein